MFLIIKEVLGVLISDRGEIFKIKFFKFVCLFVILLMVLEIKKEGSVGVSHLSVGYVTAYGHCCDVLSGDVTL